MKKLTLGFWPQILGWVSIRVEGMPFDWGTSKITMTVTTDKLLSSSQKPESHGLFLLKIDEFCKMIFWGKNCE